MKYGAKKGGVLLITQISSGILASIDASVIHKGTKLLTNR